MMMCRKALFAAVLILLSLVAMMQVCFDEFCADEPDLPALPPQPRCVDNFDESEPLTNGSTAYTIYFTKTVESELGPYLAGALYDTDILARYVSVPDYMVRVNPNKHVAKSKRAFPPGLDSPQSQLVFLKRSFSIAIGRMHRDASMVEQFANIPPKHFPLFDRAVRQFIAGQMRNTLMLAQLVIDFGPAKAHLENLFVRRNELFAGHDPLWAFLAQVSSAATPDEITTIWNDMGNSSGNASRLFKGSRAVLHAAELLYHLEYHRPPYNNQKPRLQKYMSVLRPSAACFHTHRECETPDGCRFYCNFPYLQSARDPANDNAPFHHRVLGFGSNNQFEFEMMLWKNFGYGTFEVPNKVYSITSFDCTLKQWLPPPELAASPLGWGGASFCVGDRTAVLNGRPFVSFAEMKQRILESERGRSNIADNATAPTNTRFFDEVSVLKIDVEGSEFAIFDAWTRGEAASFNCKPKLHARLRDLGTVDFRAAVPEFFSVSMVLLEIHSDGGQFHRLEDVGAFHMLHMLQQLNQLGFVMVAFEKNFYGDGCYEVAYVHYRYFTRSEVWMGSGF